jgi:hypothetical protein
MFTPSTIINAIQSCNKTFVKTFITNAQAADAMNNMIDLQATYTKSVIDLATESVDTLKKSATDFFNKTTA